MSIFILRLNIFSLIFKTFVICSAVCKPTLRMYDVVNAESNTGHAQITNLKFFIKQE